MGWAQMPLVGLILDKQIEDNSQQQMTKKISDEWRSVVVPIYKSKGNIQNCANYRGIKLISHAMKLWERVMEQQLRQKTKISENQFGFMPI